MNSLRSRLVLGFALVAIVPVALVTLLLGRRIQAEVREQSAERLASALGILQARLGADAGRLHEKLALLAADAQLKRLYLVEAATDAELREHLATQRFLLDLDYLAVVDTAGRVVADAATPPLAHSSAGREPLAIGALPRAATIGRSALAPVADGRAVSLDDAEPILYGGEPVGLVRGGFVLDSLRLAELRATSGVDLVLWDVAGHVVASTLPAAAALPASGAGDAGRVMLEGHSYLARRDTLRVGAGAGAGPGPGPGGTIVHIAGIVSTAQADATLSALRTTSIALGLAAAAIAVLLGLLWSLQISRPVERLAEFSQRISRGEWDEPLELESVRELQALVGALERMRGDLRGYRERLVASERQAAYGQMARKVAHEIKNPLTPIAISVADLKRSYDQQRPDFPQILEQAVRTIDEEVHALKRLLQSFSDFGRFPGPELAPCDVGALLDDVRALFAHEVHAGRLAIADPGAALGVRADRGQLKQALVNLVQNALDAIEARGHVRVLACAAGDAAELLVTDDGPGLAPGQREQLFVPGFTTKAHGSGLGLTIVERIVTDHGGTIAVDSRPGRGTAFAIPAAPFARNLMPTLLIVDDEANIRKSLQGALGREGYQVDEAASVAEARERLRDAYDLVLLDVWMPGGSGMDLLAEIRANAPDTTVIMMSGHATIDAAVQATRLGAFDFLEKPVSLERLLVLLRNAVATRSLQDENRRLQEPWAVPLVGRSAAVRRLLEQVALAGPSPARVLIRGEHGTGKELVARALHASSPRRAMPFVAVNCAAIPEELFESELFGHERGAFTGATQARRGRFEEAQGGTLMLDEVGDLSSRAQTKLLRVLQENELTRVGGSRPIQVDVRVVAATNRDLDAAVASNTFREDLYFRLAVIPIDVPPLRARPEDVPLLIEHFATRLAQETGRRPQAFAAGAIDVLRHYPFPGNVRELRNLVERLVIMNPGVSIGAEQVRAVLPGTATPHEAAAATTLADAVRDFERREIEAALAAEGGHMTRTAARLGLERSHLYKKLKQLGLRSDE